MKKQTAFIGAILFLIPFGQPLLFKTGVVLSSSVVLLSLPEKANAESAEFYYKRAFEKAENGDHTGAIVDYSKAIEINPNFEEAYSMRGNSRAENGDHTFAVVDYSKAIKINPKEGGYYYNRGISHLYTGMSMFPDRNITKWACLDWQKAFELGYEKASILLEEEC